MSVLVGMSLAITTVVGSFQEPTMNEIGDSALFAERPWHRAASWRARSAPSLSEEEALQAARAQIAAQQYGRARSILLTLLERETSRNAPNAQSLLGEVELRMGLFATAAERFRSARLDDRTVGRGRLAVLEAEAWTEAGDSLRGAATYRSAQLQLPRLGDWLRVREARVTTDTARAFGLLRGLEGSARRAAGLVRIDLRLAAGDSAGAFLEAVSADQPLTAIRLAVVMADSTRTASLLYELLEHSPGMASAVLPVALPLVEPTTAAQHLLVAHGLRAAGDTRIALVHAREATADSLPEAWMLVGDLETRLRGWERAVEAYAEAERSGGSDGARLRRAQALARLDPAAARESFAAIANEAAEAEVIAQALLQLSDLDQASGNAASAQDWLSRLTRRLPARREASTARWRLTEQLRERGDTAGAIRWLAAEAAQGRERPRAMFWHAKLAWAFGDSLAASRVWQILGKIDSLGYYGTMARERSGTAPVSFSAPSTAAPSAAARSFKARLDDLFDVGMIDEAEHEVAWLLSIKTDGDDLLDYAEVLIDRGFVPEGIRLGWRAAAIVGLNEPRVIRTIWPLPRWTAVVHEADEFGIDPFLLAALVYAESRFDTAAVSRAGARGLTQLMPSTARGAARNLGIQWRSDWVELSDLNLHLGSSHLAGLLRGFDGEARLALAAYNAGGGRVRRWLRQHPYNDIDEWVEEIPFTETRGYVRGVLRNMALYRALYGHRPGHGVN